MPRVFLPVFVICVGIVLALLLSVSLLALVNSIKNHNSACNTRDALHEIIRLDTGLRIRQSDRAFALLEQDRSISSPDASVRRQNAIDALNTVREMENISGNIEC